MSTLLFATGTRKKFRFESVSGSLTIEDLWQLPLSSTRSNRASLNDVAVTIHNQIQNTEQVNFIGDDSPKNIELRNKLEIVKYIIDVKKKEKEARKNAQVREEMNAEIDMIIAEKKKESMRNMSVEELEALKNK